MDLPQGSAPQSPAPSADVGATDTLPLGDAASDGDAQSHQGDSTSATDRTRDAAAKQSTDVRDFGEGIFFLCLAMVIVSMVGRMLYVVVPEMISPLERTPGPTQYLHQPRLLTSCKDFGGAHARFVRSLYGPSTPERNAPPDEADHEPGSPWRSIEDALKTPGAWAQIPGFGLPHPDPTAWDVLFPSAPKAYLSIPGPEFRAGVGADVVFMDRSDHVPLSAWLRGVIAHALAPIRVPASITDIVATTRGLCATVPLYATEALVYPLGAHNATHVTPVAYALALHPPSNIPELTVREVSRAFVLIETLTTDPERAHALCNPNRPSDTARLRRFSIRRRLMNNDTCVLHFYDTSVFVYRRAPVSTP